MKITNFLVFVNPEISDYIIILDDVELHEAPSE